MTRRLRNSLTVLSLLSLFAGNGIAADSDRDRQGYDVPLLAQSEVVTQFPFTGNSYKFPQSLSLGKHDMGIEAVQHSYISPDYPPLPLPDAGYTSGNSDPEFFPSAESEERLIYVPAEETFVTSNGWQLLPDGLLYHSYLAGEKEPRFASQWMSERDRGMIWEAVVGGRWGLFRKGGEGPDAEGFQFDVIGAAFVRIDPEEESDLEAADFNAGFLGTWHYGRWRYKLGYSHYSCHLGDEYIIKNPGITRYNYVRDSILVGTMFDITPKLQVYGEMYVALGTSGGAEPFEFQFGTQYSPAQSTGLRGAPFWAVNGHVFQENNFNGSVNAQAGWAWKSDKSGRLFRFGVQHYNGTSMQWSLVGRYENMTGMGIWFDY